MLTVYGRATSSNVQALLWGIEELGLPYERLDFGGEHGGLDTDVFRGMNPHGKIPAALIDGQAIWETGAILRCLATRHASEDFWPEEPVARAQVDMWAEWAKHEVAEAFTGPVFWRTARTHPDRQDPLAIAGAVETLERALQQAELRLAQMPFLCGEALSLADIQLGHVLYRYYDIDIARAGLPAVRAYYELLATRPAYQRTVMVSYESLRNTF